MSGVNLNNSVNDGTNVLNFLQHSLPLCYHVKDSIRHEIFADKYVDFATLLPNFEMEDESILLESPLTTLKMSSKGKRKQILGIVQWCNAFDIFSAIYFEKFPISMPGLLKYGYTIKHLTQKYGFSVAKHYDESFRKAKLCFSLNWS